MLLRLHVVSSQLQNKPGVTALVQTMMSTLSLVHQPGAEDLGSGLLFASLVVPRTSEY